MQSSGHRAKKEGGGDVGISILEMRRRDKIQQYRTDMSFSSLMECVYGNALAIPKQKMEFRWGKSQVEGLAYSLIMGFPIPPIYASRSENGRLEVVDGKQRVISLCLYHMGKFFDHEADGERALIDTSFCIREGGEEIDISYSNLPNELKEAVGHTIIPLVEIKIPNQEKKEEILRKIVVSLNKFKAP